MKAGSLWQSPADSVERISSGLQAKLKCTDRKDMLAYHNAYTEYSLALMLYASGHRPVEDPFCYRYQLDECGGFALIDDKASNESRRYRIAYLPDVAKAQMGHYLSHLQNLIDYLKHRHQRELGSAIEKMLTGSQSQKVPLFFFLKSDKVEGISNVDIGSFFHRYSPVPANIHRKWIASTLAEQQAPSWIVACCLGHMESRVLPNGNFCQESHVEIRQHINKYLNLSLLAVGWQPLASHFRPQFAYAQSLPQTIHLNRELGPVSRFKNREAKRSKAKQVIRELMLSLDKETVAQSRGSEERAEEIVGRLVEQLHEQGLPVKYSLTLFSRFLAQHLNDHPTVKLFFWNRPEQLEGTRWGNTDLKFYRQAVKVRENLFYHLESLASAGSVSLSQAKALRVFTLAVLSAQASVETLELALVGHCVFIEMNKVLGLQVGTIKLNVDHPLLIIDPISAALSKKVAICDQSNASGLKKIFLGIAKEIGLQHKNLKEVFSELSAMAKLFSQFESPGPVRAISSGVLQHTPLDLKVLTRLFYGKALAGLPNNPDSFMTGVELHITAAKPGSAIKALAKFTTELRRVMKEEAISQYVLKQKKQDRFVNGKLSRSQEKKYLATCLNSMLKTIPLPMLGQLVAHWGIWLCENKTRHNNEIQAQTVVEYLSLIAKKMRQSADDSVLYFEPTEWEQCYLQAIEGSAIGAMNSLVARLYDFHYYLVDQWRVPQIDWSELFAIANSKNASGRVDANLITLTEYRTALEYLLRVNGQKMGEFGFCAWLLFLGFRFGLRWSEAYYLLQRDVIFDTPESLYVRVQENSWRALKTRSAQRLIPLVGELSEMERGLVEKIWAATLSVGLSQNRERELLCIDPLVQEKYEEMRVSRILNSLLKQVSGDDRVRFHHLRHGYASRLMLLNSQPSFMNSSLQQLTATLLPPLQVQDAYWHEAGFPLGVSGLRGISDLLGHGDMATTIHSYLHIINWQGLNAAEGYFPLVSDRLLAMLLDRTEGAIRKKRQRMNIPRETQQLQHWLSNQLVTDDKAPMDIIDEPQICIDESSIGSSMDLSPVAIHSVMVNYAIHGRDIGLISRRLGLCESVIRSVIKAAAELEKVSGYERFAVYKTLTKPELGEFRNVVEWNNVDITLKKVAAVEPGLLKTASRAWCNAYHPSTSKYFFESYECLISFIELLMALGVSFDLAHYNFKGAIVRQNDVDEKLKELGVFSSAKRSPYQRQAKGSQNRKQSIVLDIKKLTGSLASKRQVNRFMFLATLGIT